MYASFALCGRTAHFKTELPGVELLLQVIDGPGAYVLQAVPHALDEVGHVLLDGALVLYGS